MPRTRAARLEDVAREAGVHLSTVSRVLTGAPGVTLLPETRRRVHAAARELGYRPNAMARGLRLAEAKALGLVVPSLRNPVLADITHGAVQRAREKGFVVLLAEDTGERSSQRAYTSLVEEGRIDGILVASSRIGDARGRRGFEGIPCVFVNRRRARSGRNVVMREEYAGGLGAKHLLDLGHTSLGLLAGPTDLDTARRRMKGFLHEARERGAEVQVVHVPYDEGSARAAMGELLMLKRRPTGIFISNFNQAIGAVAAVRDLNVAIPDDVSLIACDEDPIVAFLGVPLTTIKMPLAQLGVAAVDAVLDQIAGGVGRDVTIPDAPVVVDRASCAPPAARRG